MTLTQDNIIYEINGNEASISGRTKDFICSATRDLNLSTEIEFNGINIPVTTVEKQVFYNCTLRSVELPQKLKTIKISAFDLCHLQEPLNLPNSLETIEDWAFSSNRYSTLSIPANVRFIGKGAFHYNINLINITVDPNNQYFATTTETPGLFDKNIRTLILAPSRLSSYIVPKSVIKIRHLALYYEKFNTIIFPPSIKYFDHSIIYDCRSLEKIIIKGNAQFDGNLCDFECKAFQIDYHGTKPVLNMITSSDGHSITVCDGYGANTFSTFTPNVNKECPAYPYKNTCKVNKPLANTNIIYSYISIFMVIRI